MATQINPTEAVDTPVEQDFTFDDLLLGDAFGNLEEVIGNQGVEDKPQENQTQPSQEQAPAPETGTEDPNEKVRYQYWQSQADKQKAENERLQAELEALRQQAQPATQEPQEPDEPTFELPEPPQRPEPPRYFNREEALSDPTSESAKYLDDIEKWRDAMLKHSELKADYAVKLQKEARERAKRMAEQQKLQEAQQAAIRQQIVDTVERVQGEFGATREEAIDFVKTMTSKDSLSIENLWKLYSTLKGEKTKAQPSPAFQQAQRAQQVASSMGVMPAQSTTTTKPVEDVIMDELIKMERASSAF